MSYSQKRMWIKSMTWKETPWLLSFFSCHEGNIRFGRNRLGNINNSGAFPVLPTLDFKANANFTCCLMNSIEQIRRTSTSNTKSGQPFTKYAVTIQRTTLKMRTEKEASSLKFLRIKSYDKSTALELLQRGKETVGWWWNLARQTSSQNCAKRLLAPSCLSAWKNSASTLRIFTKFYIWGFFESMTGKFKVH
jgi:hypothetical protein